MKTPTKHTGVKNGPSGLAMLMQHADREERETALRFKTKNAAKSPAKRKKAAAVTAGDPTAAVNNNRVGVQQVEHSRIKVQYSGASGNDSLQSLQRNYFVLGKLPWAPAVTAAGEHNNNGDTTAAAENGEIDHTTIRGIRYVLRCLLQKFPTHILALCFKKLSNLCPIYHVKLQFGASPQFHPLHSA